MKEIIKNILTKIKDSGNVKIDTSYLKDNSWFYITDEVFLKKTVYIFRSSGELLISENGDIAKAKWENLIHSNNSMLLEINDKTSLYNIIYLNSEYLVLQKDGTDEVKVFIKQQRYTSKVPKGLNKNPFEIIFNDLNVMLNESNTNSISQKKINGEKGKKTVIEEESIEKKDLVNVSKQKTNKSHSVLENDIKNNKLFLGKKIDTKKKIDLSGVEMIMITKLEKQKNASDVIVKNKKNQRIELKTHDEWTELLGSNEFYNYWFIIV